jgi:hypothetical protein
LTPAVGPEKKSLEEGSAVSRCDSVKEEKCNLFASRTTFALVLLSADL